MKIVPKLKNCLRIPLSPYVKLEETKAEKSMGNNRLGVNAGLELGECLETRRVSKKAKNIVLQSCEDSGFKKFRVLAKRCTNNLIKAKSREDDESGDSKIFKLPAISRRTDSEY